MSERESDSVKQWRAGLGTAQQLIDARETVAARAVLEELLAFVDETWGADDTKLIQPLRLMAASYFWEHEPLDPNNQAEVECLRRALAIARSRLGDDHSEVAALAGEVGSALVVGGAIDEGCALMIECIEIATRLGELESFSRYFGLTGNARMTQGRPQDALWFFEQEVFACERYARSPKIVAIARVHLGRCLHKLDRSCDALAELELALGLARESGDDLAFIVAVKKELALVAGDR